MNAPGTTPQDRTVLSYEATGLAALAASGEGPVLDLLLQPPSRWAEVPLPLLGVILLGPGVPLAAIGLLWGLFSVDRESVLPLLIAGLPCIMLLGYLLLQSAVRVIRVLRYGALPVRIVVTRGVLAIEHPGHWGLTPRQWSARARVEVVGNPLDTARSRTVRLRIREWGSIEITEFNLRADGRAFGAELKARVDAALATAALQAGELRAGVAT